MFSAPRRAPVVVALLAMLTAIAVASPAAATPRDVLVHGEDSFYQPPSPLPPGKPGDVLKKEPSIFYTDPLHLGQAHGKTYRILYRSTDNADKDIAVSGTVMVPDKPWTGKGERPIISYAPGTQGLDDRCAPSRIGSSAWEYESLFVNDILDRGWAIAMTDYEGLGTPGSTTFAIRRSQGHVVIDAARAAQRSGIEGLSSNGPIGFSGYSQGGGASGAAAEMVADYAPELNVVGAYVGAAPADLAKVAADLEGKYAFGLVGYAIVGVDATHPELNIQSLLNADGKKFMERINKQCLLDTVLNEGNKYSKDYTVDGRSLGEYLAEPKYKAVVEEQRLGVHKPSVPIKDEHSSGDDIVSYGQGKEAAKAWCAKGATLQFDTLGTPTHVGAALESSAHMKEWFAQRFAGEPAPTNCGRF